MVQKKAKKQEKNPNFTSSEVMSLLENMNEGIHIIAESQTEVIRRLDTLEEKVNHLQDDMTDVKYKLGEKVDVTDFKKLEKRVIKVERSLVARAK